MKLDSFRDSVQAFFQEEEAFMRENWWKSDTELDDLKKSFVDRWADPGLRLRWGELVSGSQSAFDQLWLRPLFRVESYLHEQLGTVFVAEVGSAHRNTRRTYYAKRYLFSEGAERLRLLSIESLCGECLALGTVDGKTCKECGGEGWQHFGEGAKVTLGTRTGVQRIADATSGRHAATNERP